jgi:hypothetical protein
MLANYKDELAAFQRLLESQCCRRIVMYRGKESGIGKTELMTVCRELVPDGMCHVAMDLRGTTTTVTEILSRTVVRLGGLAKLQNFAARLTMLSRVPALNLADNTLKGTQNQIEVVVQNAAPVDRLDRYEQLTDAWFADLAVANRPLLLMLDTFEQANQEVQDWIGGPLLGRAADTPALRLALAGQQLPEPRLDWKHCCEVFELYGVREAVEWLPVVDNLGYRIPVEPTLTFLAGICHARNGNPGEIMKIIKGFPRK